MKGLAGRKGLELVTDFAADIPDIKLDKDKITQVIANLITNAIKFTEKGNITIKTSRANNIVKLEVCDTGVGIKASDMPKLFQKFSQLEKGLERRTGGSGLGLVISKEIVDKHGGKIGSESKFGEGSLFYFLLPIEERRTS
jgi:signal transduction histidine kinase